MNKVQLLTEIYKLEKEIKAESISSIKSKLKMQQFILLQKWKFLKTHVTKDNMAEVRKNLRVKVKK